VRPSALLHDWIFNVVFFSSAISENNINGVIIWRKKRGQGKIKQCVHPFFRDNLNSDAYIVSKEFKQHPDSFISLEILSQAKSILSRLT
jgi:hypothetical protein